MKKINNNELITKKYKHFNLNRIEDRSKRVAVYPRPDVIFDITCPSACNLHARITFSKFDELILCDAYPNSVRMRDELRLRVSLKEWRRD